VSESDRDLTAKMIGQLEASLLPALKSISIAITGVDSIELAPFPIRPVSGGVGETVFGAGQSRFHETRVFVRGVDCHENAIREDVFEAVFAYETIKSSEVGLSNDGSLRTNLIGLSIASGILARIRLTGCRDPTSRDRERA
jgi:hypothetical protein